MTAWDMQVLDYIQSHLRSAFGDLFFPIVTHLGDMGIVWIAFDIFLLIYPRTRRLGVTVAMALVLELLCCDLILKPLVARPRPFEVNTAVQLLIDPPGGYSFPSGHTGSSFAVVSALFSSKSRMWIPAAVLAGLIAWSRLYLYVHYPTDVFFAIGLGILCGWLAMRIVSRMFRNAPQDETVPE